jgi:phytoene dehydrogenase-like protein
MNEKHFDIIIAGAGMAGLTAGAYLSKYGYKVIICEQAEKPGGLVSSFDYKGFTFDAGIRAIEDSGIIFPMMKQLDIQMDMVKSPVSVGIGNRMIRLTDRESLTDMEALLGESFPDNREDIQKIIAEIHRVMKYMDVLYGIENPLFMDFQGDTQYLLKTLLPWFIKYQMNIGQVAKLNRPVAAYLRQFTDNQQLIDMIVQHFFKDTPTFFALSYFGLYLDYNYPMGGTGTLPSKVSAKIKELGGEILTGTEIISVNPLEKTLRTGAGQSYSYDKLIWAANLKTLYSILEEKNMPESKGATPWEAQKQKVLAHRGNDSVLTFFLGVNEPPAIFDEICGPHTFYTPDLHGLSSLDPSDWRQIANDDNFTIDQRKYALQKWTNAYLELTTFEISIPVLRDPNLAPEGRTGIIVSTLFDYDLVKHMERMGWYEEWKEAAKTYMVGVLTRGMFPFLEEKLEFGLTSSPLTIQKFSGNADGAITGWAFSKDGTPAEDRFKKINRSVLTPLPDIYQAGQWTFSPSGLPVSILTGKLAADLADKDLKRQRKRLAPVEPEIITT